MTPLQLICPQTGDAVPVWMNFTRKMEEKANQTGSYDVIMEATYALEAYGASTKWNDWSDPLWFPDEERMMAFVLTWS